MIYSAALPATEAREFYHADLIGMRVERRDAAALGTVKAIHDFGAGPLIEVALSGSGRTVMLPFNDTVVPVVDVEHGVMMVELPADLLDAGEADREGERQAAARGAHGA